MAKHGPFRKQIFPNINKGRVSIGSMIRKTSNDRIKIKSYIEKLERRVSFCQ